MRIAVVGPAHFGIAEPFAGGLEAHTAHLARGLQRLGHDVTVFAGDPSASRPGDLEIHPILDHPIDFSGSDRRDNAMPPGRCVAEDSAYRRLLSRLACDRFDIVHNNSLHYLVPGLAGLLSAPIVHTLHTPPFDWLRDAHARRDVTSGAVVAVSRSLARGWAGLATHVIGNGVDVGALMKRHAPGRNAIWVGRIVPEKGPHLAIDAARRAGFSIDLYGPAQHETFFETEVEPRLGYDARWHGHLDQAALRNAMAGADVGVITPLWDEPFGLATAEMSAAGLPVAAFDRGATREILTPSTGCLARPGDIDHLASAIRAAACLESADCSDHARKFLTVERMVMRYVELYRRLLGDASSTAALESDDLFP